MTCLTWAASMYPLVYRPMLNSFSDPGLWDAYFSLSAFVPVPITSWLGSTGPLSTLAPDLFIGCMLPVFCLFVFVSRTHKNTVLEESS